MISTQFDKIFDLALSAIECSIADGATLVRLVGEIDVALRDQAGAAMAFVVGQNRPVVIDVSQVGFIDSSGLAFLVQLHKMCLESDLPHVLRDPTPNLLDLLDMLGLAGHFEILRSASSGPLPTGP